MPDNQHYPTDEPVLLGPMYDAMEPRWYGPAKRCRAVDCSIAEPSMPEGFCSRCWEWVRAQRSTMQAVDADLWRTAQAFVSEGDLWGAAIVQSIAERYRREGVPKGNPEADSFPLAADKESELFR